MDMHALLPSARPSKDDRLLFLLRSGTSESRHNVSHNNMKGSKMRFSTVHFSGFISSVARLLRTTAATAQNGCHRDAARIHQSSSHETGIFAIFFIQCKNKWPRGTLNFVFADPFELCLCYGPINSTQHVNIYWEVDSNPTDAWWDLLPGFCVAK